MARGENQSTLAAPRKGRLAAPSRLEDEPFDYTAEASVYDGPPRAPVTRDPTDTEVVGIPPIGFVTIAATGEKKPFFTVVQGYDELDYLWPNQRIPPRFQSVATGTPPYSKAGTEQKTSDMYHAATGRSASNLTQGAGVTAQAQEASLPDTHNLKPNVTRDDCAATQATSTSPRKRKRKRKTEDSKLGPKKRVRSSAYFSPNGYTCKTESEYLEEDVLPCSTPVTVPTVSFNIGDQEATRRFFNVRFDELTMMPSRKMAEDWIDLACPDRRRLYKKYHRKKPSDMPPDPATATEPNWWPRDVRFIEPSHMEYKELIALLGVLLFLHRELDDEGQPRINWVAKLRESAMFRLKAMATKKFSSSEDLKYNQDMKDRALNVLLPDIFEVAQKYEDHVAQYGIQDADRIRGPQHSWYAAPKPARRPVVRKSRKNRSRTLHAQQPVNEGSMDVEDAPEDEEIAPSPVGTVDPRDTSPPSISASDRDERQMSLDPTSTVADSRSPSPVMFNPGTSFGTTGGTSDMSIQSPLLTPAPRAVHPLQGYQGQDLKIDSAMNNFPTMPAPSLNNFQHLAAPTEPSFAMPGTSLRNDPLAQGGFQRGSWFNGQMAAAGIPSQVPTYNYGQGTPNMAFPGAEGYSYYSPPMNPPYQNQIPSNGTAEYSFDSKPPGYGSQHLIASNPAPYGMPPQQQQTVLPPQPNAYYNGLPLQDPYYGS
ncbi:hypothetical protein K491DRAFT_719020 [Lophiostoma macrostomum CBS 122681]|uniref:Subtelomeric hrmA-associated cluster protein AFUB-079030/YDR124W-like helical bundle domain-containing protein n=1 Tax=Lophiostoma macrostomum CBS 122681 TaxID=1314788 RepID=A0A6A6T1E8_9PLEO|nr:hypothetical protein K491DRAFT_719020 [Lophiostoma macrostomum CBS 122681]